MVRKENDTMRPSLALSLKQADMSDIKITVDDRGVTEALNQFVARGRDLSPVMKAIAALLQAKAEQNFAAQAGPLGAWPALKKPDKKRKGGMILQDTGRLAASISVASGADFAQVGTNAIYAAIHQFGGSIERAAYSKQVRHRTDANGNLLKSERFNGEGLIFAKDSHKRALTRWFEVGAHKIDIPARPFLPFLQNGQLQAGVQASILDKISAFLVTK